MKNFIKLSTIVLNKANISHIKIEPNKYTIFGNKNLSGKLPTRFGDTSCSLESHKSSIEIINNKQNNDFEIIKEFIYTIY